MKFSKFIFYLAVACLPFVGLAHEALAENFVSIDIFHIERNKNRNLVQYSADVDKQTCQPKKQDAIHVFWRELETSATAVSNILIYEKPAYGIKSQSIQKQEIGLRLNALPKRLIKIVVKRGKKGCAVIPYISINHHNEILDEVYVYAKERWYWLPEVKWIEIRGHNSKGGIVKERISID